MVRLQHVSPVTGRTYVLEDLTVVTNGTYVPSATAEVVGPSNNIIRVDMTGSGTWDVNAYPNLGTVSVTREPGYLGNIGYRVVLEDWEEGVTPNAIALAVYSDPGAVGYLYTTGAMLWDIENEEWYTVCPPGFEPGDNTQINFAILYGATPISSFTLQASQQSYSFAGGGDWA